MTKKFRRPDGTEVTVEGSPEEIAAYERALNEGKPGSRGKPPVLKGISAEELRELLREMMPAPAPQQIWIYPQIQMSRWINPPPVPWYEIIWNGNDATTNQQQQILDSSSIGWTGTGLVS